jgi:hypothetical protein
MAEVFADNCTSDFYQFRIAVVMPWSGLLDQCEYLLLAPVLVGEVVVEGEVLVFVVFKCIDERLKVLFRDFLSNFGDLIIAS